MSGGPFAPTSTSTTPLSVSEDFYRAQCWRTKKRVILSSEITDPLGPDAGADVLVDALVERIRGSESDCVELRRAPQVFDWM